MPMNATNEHKWNECHIHFMEETNFHDTATFHLLCSHNKGQINSFYIDVHINAPTKMKNTLTAFGPFISAFLQFYFSCPFPTYLLDHSMLLAKKAGSTTWKFNSGKWKEYNYMLRGGSSYLTFDRFHKSSGNFNFLVHQISITLWRNPPVPMGWGPVVGV